MRNLFISFISYFNLNFTTTKKVKNEMKHSLKKLIDHSELTIFNDTIQTNIQKNLDDFKFK